MTVEIGSNLYHYMIDIKFFPGILVGWVAYLWTKLAMAFVLRPARIGRQQ